MKVIARFYTSEGNLMQLRADDSRQNAVIHRYDHDGEHELMFGAFGEVSALFAADAGKSLAQLEGELVPDNSGQVVSAPVYSPVEDEAEDEVEA